MDILDHRWFVGMVDVFFAGVAIPAFLVRLGPDEGQRLTTIWAFGLRVFLDQCWDSGLQQVDLVVTHNIPVLHS